MDFAREPGRTKPLPFFSPTALSVHFVYSHCLPILMSPIQEQTVAMLQGHQNVKSLAMRVYFFPEAKWTSSTCAIIFMDFVAADFT